MSNIHIHGAQHSAVACLHLSHYRARCSKERRRKQGLPEDLTPEEQAEADARRTEREEAEKKQKLNIVRPVVAIAAMRECLVTMKKQTPDAVRLGSILLCMP